MRSVCGLLLVLLAVSGPSPALSGDGSAKSADIEAGRKVYDKCIACHSPERNRTGPLHCGLLGRKAGTVEGYGYSDAMRSAAIVWSPETLDRFLQAPLDVIPGTSMGFAGLPDEAERRQLIAWLTMLTPSSEQCHGTGSKTGVVKNE